MGLSSSQGRLLMLTSRLSDIELQEIMISQRQNQLAWQSEKAAREYNESMSNYKLSIKVTEDGKKVSEDLNYKNMSEGGYLATNTKGQIYLKKDENGEWIIPNDIDGNPLLKINKQTGKATIGDGTKEYDIIDGTQQLGNAKVLQNLLMNGAMFLINTATEKDSISMSMLQADTEMEYVLDTSDDAAAQSKYEYETASVSRQDNKLDMELQQLETQHNAVMKEYDSVKEVINNNVDRTFKLFSNG